MKHPSVEDWIQRIAHHVREYVSVLTDERWLPCEPGLLVLVTGGSGVVPGLGQAILQATTDGLRQQKISATAIAGTRLLTLSGPWSPESLEPGARSHRQARPRGAQRVGID
jgi:hypothetical protein